MDAQVAIALGTVQQTFGQVGEGRHGAFRARVRLDRGETVTAIVKLGEGSRIASEAVCAVLARLVGLPVPEPVVVKYGARLGFGSVAVEPSLSLARKLTPNTSAAVESLRRWKHAMSTACFDEWVANSDRHDGNILVAGDGELWLIDHDLALPVGQSEDELNERNQLFEVICSVATDEPQKIRNREAASIAAAALTAVAVPPELASFLSGVTEIHPHVRRAHGFIAGRIAHLVSLCEHRTPVAQMKLDGMLQ